MASDDEDAWESMFANMKGGASSSCKKRKLSQGSSDTTDKRLKSSKEGAKDKGSLKLATTDKKYGTKREEKKRKSTKQPITAVPEEAQQRYGRLISQEMEKWLEDKSFLERQQQSQPLDVKRLKRKGKKTGHYSTRGFEGARSAVSSLWSLGPSRAGADPGAVRLVKVDDFLPKRIAKELLLLLEDSGDSTWEKASTQDDSEGGAALGAGSAQHRYDVGDGVRDAA